MPRQRKYNGLHDRQAAYHQTEKGKASVEKYESSERAKERKRRWWQEHRGNAPVDLRSEFIETYGQPPQALEPLNAKERSVISLYFGLEDAQPCTLEEIGRQMGVSKQRAGQIKSSALKKISG